MLIALVVTPEGLPLIHEALAGSTRDATALSEFPAHMEQRDIKADRIRAMDHRVPTAGSLAKIERGFLAQPWATCCVRACRITRPCNSGHSLSGSPRSGRRSRT
jgi:hypothetical protein